ncbi:XVIPCD domain-containing protein [Lysobacter firmicutimachus]|uniref:XVIPCD domain-containing protein n=1 Tax=Lysobacter firmicutimachus TaxID=1792846 RepID=A0AAU8MZA1_9GAMM
MGYEFKTKQLQSGQSVQLVSWDDRPLTDHRELQHKPWLPTDTRASVGFYDSTVEYMRNDWARQHMQPQAAHLEAGSVLLYYHGDSKTWHSTDALDIDHVSQWRDHFGALGVANHAEAHMAYNDVSNLRMLPSVINRARDCADNVLTQYGADSQEWRTWVEQRFAFDPNAHHPAFDPDRDQARRTQGTLGTAWSPDEGRTGLSFDTRVVGKWFEAELKNAYAGSVPMRNHQGEVQEVPLFRCAASGQLCTRDALDIDHKVPFELLSQKMLEHAPNGQLSKADALDAYNDVSNLRLVSRSTNSSHEFEVDIRNEYRDHEEPERPGEFDDFIDRDAMDVDLDPVVAQQARELGRNYRPMPWLNEHGHPDKALYDDVLNKLGQTDFGRNMSDTQRENAAGALVFAVRNERMGSVDAVAQSLDGQALFAVQGSLQHPLGIAPVSKSDAMAQSIGISTLKLEELPQQQNPTQNAQSPHQQHHRTMMQ